MQSKASILRSCGFLILFLLASLEARPGWAARPISAYLSLRLDARGSAAVTLWLRARPPSSRRVEEALARALGGPLQDLQERAEARYWALRARSDTAFQRRALQVAGQLDPAPLTPVLRSLGVSWLRVRLLHPRALFSVCAGARPIRWLPQGEVGYLSSIPVAAGAPPLRLEYGYRPRDFFPTLALLSALLLLPFGLTLWKRRAVLRTFQADTSAAWFGYWQFLRWLGMAAIPVWLLALWTVRADQLALWVLNQPSSLSSLSVDFLGGLCPPLLVLLACNLLSQPVFARVRGMEWTQRDLARQSGWSLAGNIAPIFLMIAGLDQLMNGQSTASGLCFAGALLLWAVGARRLRQAAGFRLQAVASGELRDRVFALAGQAGVKVQQIYLMPAGKGRLTNAFAMQGNRLLLTDSLVQQLSRREVDAIIAHELAHLKHRDPRKIWTRLILGSVAAGAVAGTLEGTGVVSSDRSGPLIVGLIIAVLLYFYRSTRRFEGAADRGAVALTGDPEALVTALLKITQLNLLPVQWGKWDERFLTHPSTFRRIEAIAGHSGISAERLNELLQRPETGDERYSLPPPDEQRRFSSAFKSRVLARIQWSMIAIMLLTPAAVAWLMALAQIGGAAKAVAYLGGLVGTLALYLAALNVFPVWGDRELWRQMSAWLESVGIEEQAAANGLPVGFAPDPVPRVYEGFSEWDVGFLFLGDEELGYLGEQARFTLRRDQVMEVRLGPGGPGWWRAARVYVAWRDEARQTGGVFNLRPGGIRSLRQLARETPALAKRLQAWREQERAPAPLPAPWAGFGTPEMGAVTSASPRNMVRLPALLGSLLFIALLAAGTSLLFGLSFQPSRGGPAWYVIGVASLAVILGQLPYFLYRVPEQEEELPSE